jgi:His-Xaa-Ser system protein HxsD
MKNIVTKIEEDKMLISLNNDYYEKLAIMSAAHEMTETFAVLVEPIDKNNTAVYFQPKKDIRIDGIKLKEAALDFCNKVLDQQLRLDIENRYGNLRDMIVKQAFVPVSIVQLSKEIAINDETKK